MFCELRTEPDQRRHWDVEQKIVRPFVVVVGGDRDPVFQDRYVDASVELVRGLPLEARVRQRRRRVAVHAAAANRRRVRGQCLERVVVPDVLVPCASVTHAELEVIEDIERPEELSCEARQAMAPDGKSA